MSGLCVVGLSFLDPEPSGLEAQPVLYSEDRYCYKKGFETRSALDGSACALEWYLCGKHEIVSTFNHKDGLNQRTLCHLHEELKPPPITHYAVASDLARSKLGRKPLLA